MTELSNIAFLMRSFKDRNIQNQQVDYNSDRLSNLTSNNDYVTVTSINKKIKMWVGIFKEIGGNFPGVNFLGGNFPWRNSPRKGEGESLIGRNYPCGSFLDTIYSFIWTKEHPLKTSNKRTHISLNLSFIELKI